MTVGTRRFRRPSRASSTTGVTRARTLAGAGVIVAAVLVGGLILAGGATYHLKLQFLNAGRVVRGADVRVGGVKVGSVDRVALAPNGLAEITISVKDDDLAPFHRGTRAAIRQVGAATIANNFIDVRPGPSDGLRLPDGATLGTSQTSGIVDLDAVLSAFTPDVRKGLQGLLANSSEVFAGSGSRYFNQMLTRLQPALAEVSSVGTELSSDEAQLARLIDTSATTATALSSRGDDLQASVGHVARTLTAVAGERRALADVLRRTPATLSTGRLMLDHVASTVEDVRPALRAVPPVARPLGAFLQKVTTAADRTTPTLKQTRKLLPDLTRSLRGFVPLKAPAQAALASTATALGSSKHILEGLRLYGADFILGLLNGLLAVPAGNYNRTGHYVHVEFAQGPTLLPGGILSSKLPDLSTLGSLVPGLFSLRTHQVARCPGGASPPAPDGSSPRKLDPSLCDASQNVPASVNEP